MTTHAVLSSPSGRTLCVEPIEGDQYFEMVNLRGYEVLHTDSLRGCNQYHEELAGELVSNGFYE